VVGVVGWRNAGRGAYPEVTYNKFRLVYTPFWAIRMIFLNSEMYPFFGTAPGAARDGPLVVRN